MSNLKNDRSHPSQAIDVIVKFGGSAITDKSQLESLEPGKLGIASQIIKQCRDSGLTCVVVHGAGSFGHHHAKDFGVNHGLFEVSTNEEKERKLKGFCLTRQSVTKLNTMVVNSLILQDVPAVSCSPGIGWKTKQRQPIKWPSDELDDLLRHGLVPVLHGDCCLDEDLGCCILSGDTIVKAICHYFPVKRVVFYTDVAGVYNKPPTEQDAELLKSIQVSKDGTTHTSITSSCSHHDVTGGIKLKLDTAFHVVSSTTTDVYICAVDSKEAQLATLGQIDDVEDKDLKFTKISLHSS